MPVDEGAILAALHRSWSQWTARQWTPQNPAGGQCNVTSVVVYERFGGAILKTPLPDGDHFYNWIDGRRMDFTAAQFDAPIAYADIPASSDQAASGANPSELNALRAAFLANLDSADDAQQ